MEKIEFTHNWNNKLDNDAFTTIRPHNSHRYQINSFYDIFYRDKLKGKACIVDIRRISVKQINNFIGYLDTGYSAFQTQQIIRKMYKCDDNFMIDFILLSYVKSEKTIDSSFTFPDF